MQYDVIIIMLVQKGPLILGQVHNYFTKVLVCGHGFHCNDIHINYFYGSSPILL